MLKMRNRRRRLEEEKFIGGDWRGKMDEDNKETETGEKHGEVEVKNNGEENGEIE